MMKALSVLLIIAALFGFYGGAVNIRDVMEAKAYWEDKSEKTTADLNKLEDGLNQLKDNEKAYLDGLEAVKEGKEALVKGEAELAEGEATLAQGEADYAAAPGKLADARAQLNQGESDLAAGRAKLAAGEQQLADGYAAYNQGQSDLADGKKQVADGEKKLNDAKKQLAAGEQALAAGKKQVADGEKSINGLTTLINGINSALSGYKDEWRPGYEKLKGARNQLYTGSKGSKDSLTALAAFLDSGAGAYVNAVNDVAGDDEKQTAKDYKDFIKSTNELANDLPAIQEKVKKTDENANALLNVLNSASGTNLQFAETVSNHKSNLKQLAALISDDSKRASFIGGIDSISEAYESLDSTIEQTYQAYLNGETQGNPTVDELVDANMDDGWTKFFASDQGKAAIDQAKAGIAQAQGVDPSNISDDDAKTYIKNNNTDAQAGVKAAVTEEVKKQVKETVTQKVKEGYESNQNLTNGKNALIAAVQEIATTLDGVNNQVNGDSSAIKSQLLPGLKEFNSAATEEGVDGLTNGQDNIATGISDIASAVLGNATLKKGVEKEMGKDAITLLNAYSAKPNSMNTQNADFAKFEAQMDTNPNIVAVLTKALSMLEQTKADGEKALAAGKKQVADGEKSLAAGYKEYDQGEKNLAAGKKSVSDGEKALAAAAKQLEAGEEELAAGRKELAAGEAKLADGYRQYRQGLADYEAAPAKLEEGRKAVEEGRQKLADGRKELAEGKEKLAEYEDGEKQVRDGLATLMASERYADLETILERRNGDDNFDDAKKRLDIPDGLKAVGTGREYQADTGDVVTKELSGRVIGSGLELGAAAIALLAALLSLLKKYKGAAALAIATAAVGISGMLAGSRAGMEMSSVAGSTMGATPMVAAVILAVVAALFSIVHFTAKKDANA